MLGGLETLGVDVDGVEGDGEEGDEVVSRAVGFGFTNEAGALRGNFDGGAGDEAASFIGDGAGEAAVGLSEGKRRDREDETEEDYEQGFIRGHWAPRATGNGWLVGPKLRREQGEHARGDSAKGAFLELAHINGSAAQSQGILSDGAGLGIWFFID